MPEQPIIGWNAIDEYLAPIVNLSTWSIKRRHKHMVQCKAVMHIRRGIGKRGRNHVRAIVTWPSLLMRYLYEYGNKF